MDEKDMKAIVTEVIIGMGSDPQRFSPQTCIIRVMDEAAGPYLAVEGCDVDPSDEKNTHCFYLQSSAEIDEFAAICKRILMEAE